MSAEPLVVPCVLNVSLPRSGVLSLLKSRKWLWEIWRPKHSQKAKFKNEDFFLSNGKIKWQKKKKFYTHPLEWDKVNEYYLNKRMETKWKTSLTLTNTWRTEEAFCLLNFQTRNFFFACKKYRAFPTLNKHAS